jgi:hypothetical protein
MVESEQPTLGVTMRLLVSLGLTSLLAGCAASSSGYYTQTVNSWRGGSVNNLLSTWGKPYSSMVVPGGNTVYVYKRQSFYHANATYSPSVGVSSRTNGTAVITALPNVNTPLNSELSAYCLATFTANSKGQIIDTDIQGTNCYLSNSNAKALANPDSTPVH